MVRYIGQFLRVWLVGSIWATLTACTSVVTDSQESCKFEKLAELPLRIGPALHPTVIVEIDGRPVNMVLDTGATDTLVFSSALERTGLQIDRTQHGMSSGIGGLSKIEVLRAKEVTLGGHSATVQFIAVAPFELPSAGGATIDGILGLQPLGQFDIDLDLPSRRLALYRARYCPTGAPPWNDPGHLVPRPANAPFNHLPYAPIRVNGRDLLGLLDTGAYSVALNRQVAPGIGLTEADIMSKPQNIGIGASNNPVEIRRHRFERVEFLGLAAHNPELDIIDLGNGADVLIGMPILREFRVWIPVQGGKIYLSGPTPPI